MDDNVVLKLSKAEALVLFDWLCRSNDAGTSSTPVGQAERQVFWNIESVLESSLLAPLTERYQEAVDQARRDVEQS